MLGSIEKNFFKITQRLGLLFAMLSFVAVIILGLLVLINLPLQQAVKLMHRRLNLPNIKIQSVLRGRARAKI